MAARKRKRSATRAGKKQGLDKRHFNYGRWTKGRFSEAVTVTGPAKMVFLAGIGWICFNLEIDSNSYLVFFSDSIVLWSMPLKFSTICFATS